MGRRIAIVLFNLGGPDGPDSVKPFLRNLFRDPAIIQAPGPVREGLAWLISTLREKSAKENYDKMGGGSPLVPETEKQAAALIQALKTAAPDDEFRCFIAMRYWKPFTEDAVREVEAWDPDEVVLLPLYPQFSTTTSGSSLKAWRDKGGRQGRAACCFPLEDAFIEAHANLIRRTFEAAGAPENARLLFSAHGLPEKIVKGGDPYQWQVERTAEAVAAKLPEIADWQVCYQSRVGPLKWIGPATEEAIEQACADEKHILLTPIAFVSEHIETLVELDEEYAELAHEQGAKGYDRVPALGTEPAFIAALASVVQTALAGGDGLKPPHGQVICPAEFGRCPCREAGMGEDATELEARAAAE